MSDLNQVFVAICFNDPESARALAKKVSFKGISVQFVINEGFDIFIKDLSASPRIDLLIVEENFETCSSYDLIRKMKNADRYKKTVSVLSVDDLSAVNDGVLQLKPDFLIETVFDTHEFLPKFEKILRRRLTPSIPVDYKILVLDNNQSVLEIISMHLGEMEHKNFDLCTSIAEAKNNLSQNSYNLLMLDWNLDDGTCLDVIEFINNDIDSKACKNHHALTMVITGRDDVEDIMTLLRYGVEDLIIKPFDFDEFEDKVVYALEKYNKKAA